MRNVLPFKLRYYHLKYATLSIFTLNKSAEYIFYYQFH